MSLATKLAQIPNITTNYIPRATATGFVNSLIGDDGTTVTVNGILTSTVNVNSQTNVTFQNTNTTNSSSRQGLYLTAGNRTLSFLTIHGDHNYIQGTAGANLYFQQAAGSTINMTITSAGSVGIGTTNPSNKLNIAASNGDGLEFNPTDRTGGTGSSFLLSYNRTSSTYISMQYDASQHIFYTSNGERMRITNGGTVGIGVIPANWATFAALEIGYAGNNIHVTGTNDLNFGSNIYYNGGYKYATTGRANLLEMYNGEYYFSSAASGTGNTTASLNRYMTLTNAGNLVIGNTTYNPILQLKTGGGTSYRGMITLDNSNDEISLIAGTDQGYAYGPFVHLVGKDRYGTNTAGWIDIIAGNASGNTNYGFITFQTANTLRMQISWNGAIGTTAGGTNIYNPSDYRLKKNIVNSPYGLNEVLLLKPSKFNWKDGFSESEQNKDMLGFIAQDVQRVIPEAVESFGSDVVVKTDEYDFSVTNPLRVNEKFIIPVLVKAIQEQQEQINSLKAQLGGN